jgi:hypothetical protein
MRSRRLHGVPGTAVVLAWCAVGVVLGARPGPHAVTLAVTLLGLLWVTVSLFWEGATPSCPGGVPPWWPGSVPAPGFP